MNGRPYRRARTLPIAFSVALAGSLALSPVQASGQEVTLGVKGGLNVSRLSVGEADDADFDSRTRFLVGGFAQFTIGEKFAVQPEVLYSGKGAKVTDGGQAASLGLNYIEIPLLLIARFPSRESPIYPILYAGPSVAFKTSCGVTGENEGVSVDVDCDAPLLDGGIETASTDFGLVFGGGFEILYSRLTIQLDARYTLGLTNLNDVADEKVSVKNRTWSFMIGLGIPIE